MQAVILAGGKGTRLASRLNGLPKPLVSVGGVPLLERQLRQLAAQGVTEAVVLVNHEAEQIARFLAGRNFGCRTRLVDDGAPRGTAGAVLACLDSLANRFLVVYGDTLFDIDVPAMIEAHDAAAASATLLLHPNDHPQDSDLVEVDETGRILKFHSYPHAPDAVLANLVNAAFYVVERPLVEAYRQARVPADFAKDLFPAALRDGHRLQGYRSYEYIKDLGTPSRLDKVERHLAGGVVARARRAEPQQAVFVDRDGTLNVLRDYVRTAADLELLPGVADAVRRLNEAERRVVVVTNQPVLARGECSFEAMRLIHAKLDTDLGQHGAYLDALYLCPHHPDRGFAGEVDALKIECDCRKPKAGLIERAITDMNIDRARSCLVGDSWRDIEAARRAGMTSVLVRTGEGSRDHGDSAPDFIVDDFAAAVDLILERRPRLLEALASLAQNAAAGNLILIGGLARSGKSTAASVLAAELRSRRWDVQVVALDTWPLDTRTPASGDQPRGLVAHLNLDKLQLALSDWLKGGPAEIVQPQSDHRPHSRALPVILKSNTIVILEGIAALLLPLSTARVIHRIYIECDDSRRQNHIAAAVPVQGVPATEAAAIQASTLQEAVQQIEQSRDLADHVITFDLPDRSMQRHRS